VFKEFLTRMGFINEPSQNASQRDEDEKNLVFELWKVLGGENKQHITLNNLRIFLLAIMGTFCEPGIKKDENAL
jgi:hypothetical protein